MDLFRHRHGWLDSFLTASQAPGSALRPTLWVAKGRKVRWHGVLQMAKVGLSMENLYLLD